MRIKSRAVSAAVGAFLTIAAASPAAAANLLTNGSFEDPIVQGSYQGYRPGQVIGTNNGTPWVYESNNAGPFVDLMTYVVPETSSVFGNKPTPFGNQYYVLGEAPYVTNTTQGVQDLALGHYELSFWQASFGGIAGGVNLDFRTGSTFTTTSLLGGPQLFTTAAGSDWVRQSVEFDVTFLGAHRVVLSSVAGSRGLVDNVQLNLIPPGGAVPEPATWALMILGFGGTGFALRRRRVATA